MGKILVFCGSKGSGKTSSARFVSAYLLNRAGVIGEFAQDYNGDIDVKARFHDVSGNEIESTEFATFDIKRTDYEFVRYAEQYIYPYVRIYSFGDILKTTVSLIFGLDINKLYGDENTKNELTHIQWRDIEKLFPKKIKEPRSIKYMTYREVLQWFGTNVCRTIYDDCWIEACFRQISSDSSAVSIIDDCRFPNEVYKSNGLEAKTIWLRRRIDEDTHPSEVALLSMESNNFSSVIYNQDMTLVEKNLEIFNQMKKWGWVEGKLD